MFCAECGTKNENGVQFCAGCGAKLAEQTEQTVQNVVVKEKKPMSKKNKMILAVVGAVAVVLIGLYIFLGSLVTPKKVAEDFFNATTSYDAEAIYKYLDVADSDFTSKDVFKKIVAREIGDDEDEKPTVLNYTVGDEVVAADGMSATVVITYMLKDADKSATMDIKLIKDKNKKWLLFDNWKVNAEGFDTTKGYKVKVMKGSKVTVEGIELKSEYLDKDSSTSTLDVYSMPAMFNAEYEVVVELPTGITVTDTMNVSSYSSYTANVSVKDLSDNTKDALIKASKESLQAFYDGAKDKKTFDEVKTSLNYKEASSTKLKNDYESLVSGMTAGVTSITFNDITLSSIDMESDGTLELYLKATFDYSISYESGEEVKTHDDSDYDYLYLTFEYVDGSYKLVDTSNLNTYFSKY